MGKAAKLSRETSKTEARSATTGALTSRPSHNPKLAFVGLGLGNGSPEAIEPGAASLGARAAVCPNPPAGAAGWAIPGMVEGIMPGATRCAGAG